MQQQLTEMLSKATAAGVKADEPPCLYETMATLEQDIAEFKSSLAGDSSLPLGHRSHAFCVH